MPYQKNSHCSFCGQAFAENQPWPRRCPRCGNSTYQNPLPVAVLLLPVDGGLLTVRRTIPPKIGELALPGGFIGLGETWQEAAARELLEETGITVDPGQIANFGARSAAEGMLLVFGIAPERALADLPAFVPSAEADELVILRAPQELAFPLHTEAMRDFFSGGVR